MRAKKGHQPMTGAERIAGERGRQIVEEGWTPEHDDRHAHGELAIAAACYALHGIYPSPLPQWPWAKKWDKRSKHGRVRRLEIAGALIAAEIDRLQRADVDEE